MTDAVVMHSCTLEENEADAAKAAGFALQQISLLDALQMKKQDIKYVMASTHVFVRHQADEHPFVNHYLDVLGSQRLIVPNYAQANEWYKVVPFDYRAGYWLQRKVSWVDVSMLDDPYSENDHNPEELELTVRKTVDYMLRYANHKGKIFMKDKNKRSIEATQYTPKRAIDRIMMKLCLPSHAPLSNIVYSQIIDIDKADTDYKRAEFRCFVIGGKCSTVSYYTNETRKRPAIYDKVEAFANEFGAHFLHRLPRAYCLDVGLLTSGRLAVIELNDISASGYYGDNDLYKIYKDLYQLTVDKELH